MTNRRQLNEKAFDTLLVHNAVISQLSKFIDPELSYSGMVRRVIEALQHIADAFGNPDHKLYVALDFIVNDRAGRVTASEQEVWMMINIEGLVDQLWPFGARPEAIRDGINEIADEFCGLYVEYLKLCSGWKVFGNADKPFSDPKAELEKLALKASHELLRHFQTPSEALTALHNDTQSLANISPAIFKAIHTVGKPDLRMFLKYLYTDLQGN